MLYIDIDNFALDKRIEIKDSEGNVRYWSQPDFSYKHRVHLYDDLNNEIGYIQYIILTSQNEIEYYDNTDNKIDLSDYRIVNYESKWNYDIENNGNVIANVKEENNQIVINIIEQNEKCLLKIYGSIEKGE